MKKIIVSSLIALAAVSAASTATYAYFSSQSSILGNTVATGTLEIRVDGQPTATGATFSPVIPGVMPTPAQYAINNYGGQFFLSGSSNISAKKLYLSVANPNDYGSGLWNHVKVKIEAGRLSGNMQYTLFDGYLKDVIYLDLFQGHWPELALGSTQDIRYTPYLEESGANQNSLMGKKLKWDFVVEGRSN